MVSAARCALLLFWLAHTCGKFFKFISDDDLCVMNHRPLAGVHMYVDSVHEAN